jgi:DNA-binding transcriptional ArsR family regulator
MIMADNVVFLEPGDERAQKIAKAMGSQTASDILQILGEGPRSLTDITEQLNIPMNTAKYHIENLLDAGLIAVEQTRYSIKGREVKIYTLTNQLLVVAPRESNVRSLLLKYASLFGIVAVGSVLISVLSQLFGPGSLIRGSVNSVNAVPQVTFSEDGGTVAKAVVKSMAQNVTAAPDVMLAGTKGVADTWAANATPVMVSTHASTTMATAPSTIPLGTMPPIPAPTIPPGSMESGAGAIFPLLDPALAFFLGGVLVIFILVCYEAWVWKKQYK